jgi:hypothetical protein
MQTIHIFIFAIKNVGAAHVLVLFFMGNPNISAL